MTSTSGSGRGPLVVAQVCHGSLGGSSRAACRLANALTRRGHEVHLFARFVPPWPLEPRVIPHAISQGSAGMEARFHRTWSEPDLAAFADLLAEVLATQRFDVLHYHYAQPFAGLIGRISARLGERMPPAIGTLHGTDLTRSLDDGAELAPLGAALAATGALTTVSQHMSRLVESQRGAIPLPRVLPNFVEDDWPGTGPEARSTPPAILHVSNFRAVKDVGLLARLFLAVYARTEAELWLVGDGPELPSLRRLLERSPAAPRVRYFGACAEPQAQFRAATLLLSTSLEESFGLAVLEAMASGTPVVATAVGGIPELVEDEVTGLLFGPADWEQTAARMAALLEAPERLLALGRACLVRAAPFRESRVIARYEGLYRQVLGRPAGHAEA